jgi:hypothetical protein
MRAHDSRCVPRGCLAIWRRFARWLTSTVRQLSPCQAEGTGARGRRKHGRPDEGCALAVPVCHAVPTLTWRAGCAHGQSDRSNRPWREQRHFTEAHRGRRCPPCNAAVSSNRCLEHSSRTLPGCMPDCHNRGKTSKQAVLPQCRWRSRCPTLLQRCPSHRYRRRRCPSRRSHPSWHPSCRRVSPSPAPEGTRCRRRERRGRSG